MERRYCRSGVPKRRPGTRAPDFPLACPPPRFADQGFGWLPLRKIFLGRRGRRRAKKRGNDIVAQKEQADVIPEHSPHTHRQGTFGWLLTTPSVTARCPTLACHPRLSLTSLGLCHATRQDTRWVGKAESPGSRKTYRLNIGSPKKNMHFGEGWGWRGYRFPTVTDTRGRAGGPSTLPKSGRLASFLSRSLYVIPPVDTIHAISGAAGVFRKSAAFRLAQPFR